MEQADWGLDRLSQVDSVRANFGSVHTFPTQKAAERQRAATYKLVR